MSDLRPQPQPVQTGDSNGMGIAAMIIGLCSALIAIIPVFGLISFLIGPLAIVFGLIGMGKETGKGFAITGIISGGIGLVICILWMLVWWGLISAGQEIEREMRQIQSENARTYKPAN